jgi:D-beta-D-heptose 7-phosphate kinase/D-beta-D-heptose 1-phosphate adenosyltransferase
VSNPRGLDPERARELVGAFADCRVLVFGDFMLDRYVWGSVDRISPESPVPVVVVDRESTMLGGAGNVARNLASLGAEVDVVTVVGDDAAADELRRLMAGWKIPTDGFVVDASRPTTEKTRVVARNQQVVRYDRESDQPVDPDAVQRVLAAVRERAPRVQGVVIEDYAKGLLSHEVLRAVMKVFRDQSVRCFVDPKAEPWDVYEGAELVKPNLREASLHVRGRVRDDDDLDRVGRQIVEATGAQMVAITRGEEGMDLFSGEGRVDHAPAHRRAVSDLAGAGDTAIAVLAVARLSGATWGEAARLAMAAAGYVVGIPGTATLTPDDLVGAVRDGR